MIQISEKIFCDDFLHTAVIDNKNLPNPYNDYPFLIIENFLTPNEAHTIATSIQEQSDAQQAKVKTKFLDSVVVPSVVEEIRKTTLHTLPRLFEELYIERFLSHQQKIEDFFSMGFINATPLQILVYREGDFYIKHADDSSELVDKNGQTVGFNCVAPQRKITTVLFGTSHESTKISNDTYSFEGGELVFNYLYDKDQQPVILYPKAGDMVIFFSNPFFSHEVKPVTSGYRLTMVQWHNAL
ncbi:2OG-Fe(II) oxygenase [bacterium]|nr:2OG-Fe(II) oxygenase [bacterium]MBU1957233.1 2OG-Fe(II) oxygenase [bacterium]